MNLEDTKSARQDWPVIKPQIKAIDKYSNTTVGILNISDFDAFELSFENSTLSQYNLYYDLNVSLPPYDVYTLRAINFTRREASNLNYQLINGSYKFYVANTKNCKLKFRDHFNAWMQNCDLGYNATSINLKTGKFQYNEGEIINVTLEPKNTPLKVKYGQEELTAIDSAQFIANPHYNKISVYFENRESEEIIHVKEKGTWEFALNLGVFSGVLYFIYSLVKKYWGALF